MWKHRVDSFKFSNAEFFANTCESLIKEWEKAGYELVTVITIQDTCVLFFKTPTHNIMPRGEV